MSEGVTVAELSRQVRDTLVRFEGLTKRLEDQFIRKDILDLYKESITAQLGSINTKLQRLEETSINEGELKAATDRISQLEDDKKWLIRLVLGFIVLAVLGVLFASGGLSP